MSYAKMLKTLFQGVTLNVEDLFFLESFQIKYLADRVPKKEFAWDINEIISLQFLKGKVAIDAGAGPACLEASSLAA